jgi:hypothetical protein
MPYFITFQGFESEHFKEKREADRSAKHVVKLFPNCEVSIWRKEGLNKIKLETIIPDPAQDQDAINAVLSTLKANGGVISKRELINVLRASDIPQKQIDKVLSIKTNLWSKGEPTLFGVKLEGIHYFSNKTLA